MPTDRNLPGWMYSLDEEDDSAKNIAGDSETSSTLTHLMPRLKEYLTLVDPSRVIDAPAILSRFQTEEALFGYLESTYGGTVSVDSDAKTGHDSSSRDHKMKRASHSSQSSPKRSGLKAKQKRKAEEEDEDDLSDFIVPDSEDEEPEEEEEEEEFEESESDVDEPEPDLDFRKRRRHPGPPPPAHSTSKPPMPTKLGPGPTIVCKYGKDCYRKNPVHFEEFAHPWLLNKPPHS